MPLEKTKITQKEFDDMFEIEEITEEIPSSTPASDKESEDTTPDLLSKEEQEYDDKFHELLPIDEENTT